MTSLNKQYARSRCPFGRSGRKKDVAQSVVLPPDNDTTYADKPIPPNYAMVVVVWTNIEFDEHDLDIPSEDGVRFIGETIGSCVLWNKSDILLEMPMPASQPSQPSSSPPAGPSDDDEGGGDDNDSERASRPLVISVINENVVYYD